MDIAKRIMIAPQETYGWKNDQKSYNFQNQQDLWNQSENYQIKKKQPQVYPSNSNSRHQAQTEQYSHSNPPIPSKLDRIDLLQSLQPRQSPPANKLPYSTTYTKSQTHAPFENTDQYKSYNQPSMQTFKGQPIRQRTDRYVDGVAPDSFVKQPVKYIKTESLSENMIKLNQIWIRPSAKIDDKKKFNAKIKDSKIGK